MQRNRAYRFIFWGLLLSMLHINIGQLQMLPNFIAAMIIVRGISILLEDTQNHYLLLSRRLCQLYVVSQTGTFVVQVLQQHPFISEMNSPLKESSILLALGVNSILMTAVMFYLLMGSEMLLMERNGQSLLEDSFVGSMEPVKSISKMAINFTLLYTISTILMVIGLVFRSELGGVTIISTLTFLIAMVMAIFNVAYLRKQYPEF